MTGGRAGQAVIFRIKSRGTLASLWLLALSSVAAQASSGLIPTPSLSRATETAPAAAFDRSHSSSFQTVTHTASTAAQESTLYAFDGSGANGGGSFAALIQATDGDLYGTTAYGGGSAQAGTVFRITTSGQLTTLHAFNIADGAQPQGALLQGSDGAFYGTTLSGGTYGSGTVFRMTPDGALTTLYSFAMHADDGYPNGTLVQTADGNLYGTTGGMTTGTPLGTVFKIAPNGEFSTVHSFGAILQDGAFPQSLIVGSDGNLYGVTGSSGLSLKGGGTVFRLTPSGTLTTLHTFPGMQGSGAVVSIMQASDGNFYGLYGTSHSNIGGGVIFRLAPDGSNYQVVYTFTGTTGGEPRGSLIQGSDGNLYGVTITGGVGHVGLGPAYHEGSVFQLSLTGTFTRLYSFYGANGAFPNGVIEANNGVLYGTTNEGGPVGADGFGSAGVIFQISGY